MPASEMIGELDDVNSVGLNDMPGTGFSDDAAAVSYSTKQIGRVRELLTRLYAVRRTAKLYPIDHPAVAEGVEVAMEAILRYHEEGVDVVLAFFEGEVLFGDQLLPEESLLFDQLVREFNALGVGSLVIRRGISLAELTRAMSVLAADGYEAERVGGIERMVHEAGLPHISVGEVRVFEREEEGGDSGGAQESYNGALDLMREIDRLVRSNKAVSTGRVKSAVRSLVDNVLTNRYAMLQLTGLKNYDEYTFYHSANVAILSLALGAMFTTDYRFLSSLGVGSLLHDIGKMTVDLEILNKPGALSPEEWARIRQHPVYGAEQAAVMPGLDKSALVTILEHHMRYDGGGYPHRSLNRPQHLTARIVAVADAYDAMTSHRSYSAARVQDDAMRLLVQGAGTAHDPVLVRLFVTLMGVYPPRSVVRLSTDETGIVLRPSENDSLRPLVRVVASSTGEMVEPYDVDTAQADVVVVRCLDPQDINIDVDDYI
ncbi:MAG: HD-GYP domain-containing protein [Actinomycetota bacterium]|nr:HD-GYP domain-containing protein [Actinomycetota bacterium]